MSSYNTPNRLRQTSKTTRAYDSSDNGTPSPARYRSKRNRNDENSCVKNKFDGHFDENANDQFHDDKISNRSSNKLDVKNDNTPRTPKPSFEEEQQELKKSLSKDWCDKMDNAEAEEKKLHSFVLYLKQFPMHKNKTTEELLTSIECCPKELLRRQKEISKGKLSNAYQNYISTILRKCRTRQHPRTPCKYAKMSRRGFDGSIKAWRRKLHEFNGDKTKENSTNNDDSFSSSQRSDGYSTPSSTSMSLDETDENFLPDLYDFEEALTNNEPFIDLDVADSMDTIVNNVDSRSAMSANPEDVSPVIATPHHYLINICRNNLYFVAVLTNESAPLFVIEFLHRIMDVFEDYFTTCNETTLKDNYVIVYELLDEMLDSGLPLVTETNTLKELIKPPNLLRKVANLVTGDSTNVSDALTSSQLSNIPWRRLGVKYANNEAYFDLIEEIDAIIDRNGTTIMGEIQGYIDCCVKLSGMPDLTLTFVNPRLLDDVSLHPCIRLKKWESEKSLSFIPPDGNFRLISYHIGSQNSISIPIYVKHNIQYREGSAGRFELTVGPKQTMGKSLEAVAIECAMPKSVLNCTLTPSQGKCTFDPVKKVLTWDIGKIETNNQNSTRLPTIRGNITLAAGQPVPEGNPTLNVRFTINQVALSGIRVQRVDMHGESYKPFKGVKYITTVKNGRFQIRT
ncbi:unnamed protein product [Adineta steineri]|uniref:MHD domain-containing protein n=2 Tax=Adineta steineri TaxID=433720 RepID=A0A814NAZ8_9BILA|nr:unnamed protein product [Adineta steineri]CAF3790285.1 unnamed protein product [Adineta steineri]